MQAAEAGDLLSQRLIRVFLLNKKIGGGTR
jgi:hypothetical protein